MAKNEPGRPRVVTKEFLHVYAGDHEGFVDTTTFTGGADTVEWRCMVGHTWVARPYDVLSHKSWCPDCAISSKKSALDEMRALAIKKGGICTSTVYENSRSWLTWRCARGHEWRANPHNISSGSWCPECARLQKINPLTIEDMAAMAMVRGGDCLSREYAGEKAKLRWRCAAGHEWESVPTSIAHGSWCPTCTRARFLLTGESSLLKRATDAAAAMGGAITFDIPRRGSTYPWRCKAGHVFHAHTSSVATGKWCPWCKAGDGRVIKPRRTTEPGTFTIKVGRMFVADGRSCRAFRAQRIDLSTDDGYKQVATWLWLLATSGAMGRPPAGSGKVFDALAAGTITGKVCVQDLLGHDPGLVAASIDIPGGGEAGWFVARTRSYDLSEPVDVIVHACLYERFTDAAFVLPAWRAAILLGSKWLVEPAGETLRKAIPGRYTPARVAKIIEKHLQRWDHG